MRGLQENEIPREAEGEEVSKNQIPLTDWECGQELIKAVDTLDEIFSEIYSGHPDIAQIVFECSLKIGREFNKLKSHDFGLRE